MFESVERASEWFRARSEPQRFILAAAVVLALVLASPVVWAVAVAGFVAAVVGLVAALVRRRPVRIWLVAGGIALVGMMVFGTFVESIYGPVEVPGGLG